VQQQSAAAASHDIDRSAYSMTVSAAGPFEARLRELGVTGQRYLGRAASIDRTGRQVLAEAAAEILDRSTLPADQVGAVAARPVRRRSARQPLTAALRQQELEAEP
jgi:hypothetical protein